MGAVIAEVWTLAPREIAAVLAFTAGAWYLGAITVSATAGVVIVGVTVLLAGGWPMAVPLLVFFLTSVSLSNIHRRDTVAERSRSFIQVLANGAVAWFGAALMLFPDTSVISHSSALHIYFGALAAANADTWATEIGTRWGGLPRDILTGRPTSRGASGAITSLGMVGSILGALAVACTYPIVTGKPFFDSSTGIAILTGAGLFGSVIDSVLGSTMQTRYRCLNCGSIVETSKHCGRKTIVLRGFMSNHFVNFLCTVFGALMAWIWMP